MVSPPDKPPWEVSPRARISIRLTMGSLLPRVSLLLLIWTSGATALFPHRSRMLSSASTGLAHAEVSENASWRPFNAQHPNPAGTVTQQASHSNAEDVSGRTSPGAVVVGVEAQPRKGAEEGADIGRALAPAGAKPVAAPQDQSGDAPQPVDASSSDSNETMDTSEEARLSRLMAMGDKVGPIVVGCVAAVLAIALIAGICVCCRKYARRRSPSLLQDAAHHGHSPPEVHGRGGMIQAHVSSPGLGSRHDAYRGVCPSCLTNNKTHALVPCSHLVCVHCAEEASACPICRSPVISRNWVLSP